jgi:hypothetical protein
MPETIHITLTVNGSECTTQQLVLGRSRPFRGNKRTAQGPEFHSGAGEFHHGNFRRSRGQIVTTWNI